MPDFHNLTIKSCLKKLQSSSVGLTGAEAERRRKKYGSNSLEKGKPLSKLVIFLSQLKSPLIYVLLAAGVISFFLQEYVNAGVIFGAVVLNTVIGFFQENKASQALSKLREMVEHKTLVLRGGQKIEINSRQLVVGDIIILQAGNRIPADGRIIEANNLQINEANLTGESIPSSKSREKVYKGAALADMKNMVFSGTIAVRGTGRALITAIGARSEMGKVANLVKTTVEEKTPLQLRLYRLSKFLGVMVFFVFLFVMGIGFWQGRDFFEIFFVGVAIAVSVIPEGLAVAVTVILVLGMQRILKEKALTRKLVAVETLGSTTVICTDKTGTLTEGKMQVSNIIIGEKEFEVRSLGSRQDKGEAKIVSLALQIAMMCNDAVIENPEEELAEWKFIGSPTETALLSAAYQSGLDREKLLKIEPKIAELPFESEAKFMVTLHKKVDGSFVLYEKGAPEKLLQKANKFYHHDKLCELTEVERTRMMKTHENFTAKGARIIGVAWREYKNLPWPGIEEEKKLETIDKDLVFVGFIALKDPLRPEAKETIEICRRAGIRPIIITGDHALTARAIAKEIGLEAKAENIMSGETLDKTDDKKLEELVKKIDVYARVSPHHKLRIIKAWQARGEVVAMTGDGVNDSPALKVADIGVALGTGTDIAKETSDIVLLDNNFKTIVSAVFEGRIIFSNIRKVITYLLADGFSEIILIVGSIILGSPLAILPVQILWINIVNDGLPDFSLAFEKGEKGIMAEKPIKKGESIMNKEMKIIIFVIGIVRDSLILGLFFWLYHLKVEINYLRTILFVILGIKSLLSIFSLRSFKQPIWRFNPFSNLYLIGAVAISTSLLVIPVYWRPLQLILSTVSLSWDCWLLAIATGVLSIIMIEAVKYYFANKAAK